MTVSADDVVLEARYLLLDTDIVAWTDDEMYRYLSDGVRAACNLKPDLHVLTAETLLVEGVKQAIPEDGLQLFDIVRNLPTGRAITQVSRQLLTDFRPDWPGTTSASQVKHFMTDNDNVTLFFVYPPNDGTGAVEVVYGAIPDGVEAGGTIPISAAYQPALVAYAMAQALAKNTKRQDTAKSQYWMQVFSHLVTGRTQTQLAVAPSATQPKKD